MGKHENLCHAAFKSINTGTKVHWHKTLNMNSNKLLLYSSDLQEISLKKIKAHATMAFWKTVCIRNATPPWEATESEFPR